MKTMLLYVTIAVIFVAGTFKVFGQDKAEAPTYKDGDSWVFRSKLGGTSLKSSNDPNGDYELTYSGGKVKALKIEGEQKSATSDRVGDLWILLALEEMVSKYQYIQFPVFVGKKWSHSTRRLLEENPTGSTPRTK